MIKPVTFQGCFNFNANLYALEVKSRFIDQSKANGYYTGYGNELAAQIVGQTIQIGTGAFIVQGRMCEVTATETVAPQIFDGFVGYVIARIETYHPSDDNNCALAAVVNRSFEAITLEQSDVYAPTADNVNTAYELPIYSFEISGTQIINLKKLITPVADYATIKTIVDNALKQATDAFASATLAINAATAAETKSNDAVSTAEAAEQKADDAVSTAEAADNKAETAITDAEVANDTADNALEVANGLSGKIDEATQVANDAATLAAETKTATEAKVNELETQIAERQGTTITIADEPQTRFAADGLIDESDDLTIGGGNA